MKPIPIRRLRFLTALLSTLLLLAGSVFAYPLMNAAPAAASTNASNNTDPNKDSDADKDEVSITLDEVTPWIDDEGTLTVRGTISNTTKKAVEKPNLSLQMSTRKLDSESRLDSWKQGQAQHRTVADLEHDGTEARERRRRTTIPIPMTTREAPSTPRSRTPSIPVPLRSSPSVFPPTTSN